MLNTLTDLNKKLDIPKKHFKVFNNKDNTEIGEILISKNDIKGNYIMSDFYFKKKISEYINVPEKYSGRDAGGIQSNSGELSSKEFELIKRLPTIKLRVNDKGKILLYYTDDNTDLDIYICLQEAFTNYTTRLNTMFSKKIMNKSDLLKIAEQQMSMKYKRAILKFNVYKKNDYKKLGYINITILYTNSGYSFDDKPDINSEYSFTVKTNPLPKTNILYAKIPNNDNNLIIEECFSDNFISYPIELSIGMLMFETIVSSNVTEKYSGRDAGGIQSNSGELSSKEFDNYSISGDNVGNVSAKSNGGKRKIRKRTQIKRVKRQLKSRRQRKR